MVKKFLGVKFVKFDFLGAEIAKIPEGSPGKAEFLEAIFAKFEILGAEIQKFLDQFVSETMFLEEHRSRHEFVEELLDFGSDDFELSKR